MTNPSYSVYQLPSGRQRLHLMWYEGPKRCQRGAGTFPTKRAARAAGDVWKADVLRGDAVRPSTATLDGWLDAWLELCELRGLRPRTIYDYANKLRLYVRPQLGELLLQELDPLHLDAVYASMAKSGLAPRTIRYTHSILRKALADAVAKGLLAHNLADRATPPRARAAKAAERVVWTPEELDRFLDSLDGSAHRVLFHMLAMTGLRRSEACALRWSNLDLEAGVLHVREGLTQTGTELHIAGPKTERGRRSVELDPELVAVLRAHRRAQLEQKVLVGPGYHDQGLVFARPDGQPWKPDSVTATFRRLVHALDVTPITLHDLRHGHATYLLDTATDHNTVADRLGHATAGFTLSTYGHSLPGRQAEAVRRVAELVRGTKRSG